MVGGIDFVGIEDPSLTYMLTSSHALDGAKSRWVEQDVRYFDSSSVEITAQYSMQARVQGRLDELDARAPIAKSMTTTVTDNYAVLFVGGVSASQNFYGFYQNMVDTYVSLVVDRSVSPRNIYLLYADGDATGTSINLDVGEPSDMTFATTRGTSVLAATRDNFNATMASVASKMTESSYLFLYADDHGSGAAGDETDCDDYVCGWGWDEDLSGPDVRDALYQIKSGWVTCAFGECFSGGILDDILDPETGAVMSSYDGAAHFVGAAAANHYEYSYIEFLSSVGYVGFINSVTRGLADYSVGTELFEFAKGDDPFAYDGDYPNNGGAYDGDSEHPRFVGESFDVFTTNTIAVEIEEETPSTGTRYRLLRRSWARRFPLSKES